MPRKKAAEPKEAPPHKPELVVITGLSGSGKGSVLKALEDLGFYSVDNLPVELIPKFAELTGNNPNIQGAALVVDIREGAGLKMFPKVFAGIRKSVTARLIFLEADDDAIVRRFSETRRPHPLGTDKSITRSIESEREQLAPIRAMADLIINTSRFTVHQLRDFIEERFRGQRDHSTIQIYVTSFGFRHGVLPHDIREGKSYLTISFGCTGGQHRSVMIADEVRRTLSDAGFKARVNHRDIVNTP